MNEEMGSCEQSSMMPPTVGIGKMSIDPVTEKLRTCAIDSLNAFLIRLLEKKDFCQAQRVGEALRKLV